jgi:hypothetical protein
MLAFAEYSENDTSNMNLSPADIEAVQYVR